MLITLPPGVTAFGVTIEPNVWKVFNITATANDGLASATITQDINGNAGAKWYVQLKLMTPAVVYVFLVSGRSLACWWTMMQDF
jgi:hypothetical protein